MSHHYITTHGDQGESVFSTKVPTEHYAHDIPGGKLEIIYSAHTFPPNLSTELDIDQYAHDRTHGLPAENPICPVDGTATAIVSMPPNAVSLMHRTMTLDVAIVIEGVIELHLEGGESRTLHAGDSITQRGTMHMWKNVTPDDGWARMAGFATPIAQPFEVAGKRLETEWRM
ncbi:hypothetical protein LTR36_010318 [Oleoguttula mirabilis]|uniref:Cupin type-2 domain-containing protein n=1 Tax=Oleoguttula mirabilis TaxID=1507867 RepID=A0AAV9J5C4_9PEZI|nr:hypothetical protein LTR36_010318 [Oleoguttula mirabilis]